MKILRTLTFAAFSAALVFAQRGPGGPGGPGDGPGRGNPPDAATRIQMRVNFLAGLLNLTDDQKAKATTIFTEADTARSALRTNEQSVHTALGDAIKNNDSTAMAQAAAALGTLAGQAALIDAKAQAAFYALLTADQKTKYDSMPHGGPGPGPRGFGAAHGPRSF